MMPLLRPVRRLARPVRRFRPDGLPDGPDGSTIFSFSANSQFQFLQVFSTLKLVPEGSPRDKPCLFPVTIPLAPITSHELDFSGWVGAS